MNAASKTFAAHAAGDRTQKMGGYRFGETQSKTPVSFLQEICAKRQTVPKYELLNTEGQVHNPTFAISVTVDDLTATGNGSSKKYAKHLAAKNMLDRLVTSGRHLLFQIPGETNEEALAFIQSLMPEPATIPLSTNQDENQPPNVDASSRQNIGVSESDDVANPIGSLQEVCMRKKWPPAFYELTEETGLPHNRLFTYKVHLGSYNQTGSGRTKKVAKREAALKMLEFLVEVESQEKTAKNTLMRVNDDDLQKKFATIMSEMGHKVKPLVLDDFTDVKAFFEYLKGQPTMNVEQYMESARRSSKDITKTVNFVYILHQVSQVGKFEITYADLKSRTFTGEFQCLAQVLIPPVFVVHGSGDTPEDAKQSAAYHALEYLKLITSGQ